MDRRRDRPARRGPVRRAQPARRHRDLAGDVHRGHVRRAAGLLLGGGRPVVPSARWGFELAAEDDGTRLRQWAKLGPGPSGLTPAIKAMPDKEERIVARRLAEHEANMRRCVDGIRSCRTDAR